MDSAERKQRIERFGLASEELTKAISHFPKEMWHFRDEHGCWSIHEHIVHLADSEANSYVRCRRLISEPGKDLMAYDENRWAELLDYHSVNTEGAIDLFRVLRRQTYELIKGLPERVWANACYHPENGVMTLDDWLGVYEVHVAEHVVYMKENYETWCDTQKQQGKIEQDQGKNSR